MCICFRGGFAPIGQKDSYDDQSPPMLCPDGARNSYYDHFPLMHCPDVARNLMVISATNVLPLWRKKLIHCSAWYWLFTRLSSAARLSSVVFSLRLQPFT